MQIVEGMIVKSLSGHDKNRYYLVIYKENNIAYIADGKRRKLNKLKRKNIKHLNPTKTIIDTDLYKTDKALRNLLWEWNYSDIAVTG